MVHIYTELLFASKNARAGRAREIRRWGFACATNGIATKALDPS